MRYVCRGRDFLYGENGKISNYSISNQIIHVLLKTACNIRETRGNDISERRKKRFEIIARRCKSMSNNSNKVLNPNAREALNKFKMEAASDEDVPATS